ncbi:MAG: Crp/Fnr family transcriptional regulator [Muribaculaceae bacterium]|nr:Crp/Fnr family transcriptional regulator [Muribaculaceae bacterium]
MDSIFDILADIPLFRGVTHERIAQTVGSTRFHFLKYSPGDTIVTVGEACTHIMFVISGKVRVSISNSDGRFQIAQTLEAPDVILPDFLFGSSTIYPGTVVAEDNVSVVRVSKNDYIKILTSDDIFLFNFLNYLSMNAQKCVEGVLAMTNGSIEERLAMWVVAMTQPTARDITITCRQRDLYSMFGVQRSSYMAAIERMVESGIITYQPGQIKVVDRRTMLGVMRNGLE